MNNEPQTTVKLNVFAKINDFLDVHLSKHKTGP